METDRRLSVGVNKSDDLLIANSIQKTLHGLDIYMLYVGW